MPNIAECANTAEYFSKRTFGDICPPVFNFRKFNFWISIFLIWHLTYFLNAPLSIKIYCTSVQRSCGFQVEVCNAFLMDFWSLIEIPSVWFIPCFPDTSIRSYTFLKRSLINPAFVKKLVYLFFCKSNILKIKIWKIFYSVIKLRKEVVLNYYTRFCRSIISQSLSILIRCSYYPSYDLGLFVLEIKRS